MKGDLIFCAVRQTYVARTPEESVRQRLLGCLFGERGYPNHLTRVEVSLDFFAVQKPVPRRRLDIVSFYKKEDSILPLLLIECKAFAPPSSSAMRQLFGYNFFVKAPFTAVAWQNHIFVQYGNETIYEGPFSQVPSYDALVHWKR